MDGVDGGATPTNYCSGLLGLLVTTVCMAPIYSTIWPVLGVSMAMALSASMRAIASRLHGSMQGCPSPPPLPGPVSLLRGELKRPRRQGVITWTKAEAAPANTYISAAGSSACRGWGCCTWRRARGRGPPCRPARAHCRGREPAGNRSATGRRRLGWRPRGKAMNGSWVVAWCPARLRGIYNPTPAKHTGMKDIELFRLYLKSNTSSA